MPLSRTYRFRIDQGDVLQGIVNRVWANDISSSNEEIKTLLKHLAPYRVAQDDLYELCIMQRTVTLPKNRVLVGGDLVLGHNLDDDGQPMDAFRCWSPRTLVPVIILDHIEYL